MVHQRFTRCNNFKHLKFFCWYLAKFNDIKFSRYFKLCFLILPLNCLLHDVMQCFILHPSFYGLLVLQIWWPPSLSIIMNVNYSHGGKKFLCKFCCFNILFGAHQVEDVILVIFTLSKFIVFVFELFQSPQLIKCVLYAKTICWIFLHVVKWATPEITNLWLYVWYLGCYLKVHLHALDIQTFLKH
jgi:hypothetical protein